MGGGRKDKLKQIFGSCTNNVLKLTMLSQQLNERITGGKRGGK